MSAADENTVRTTCPYCGVGCGVLATPLDDGSVEIAGDPDHPANFGRLCSKGAALGETLSLDDRLLFPEVGGKRTDWGAALDRVAFGFSEAIAAHGPDSVALYVSGQILTEDYYVANKLMKGFVGSANIDTNSRLCMASSVAGHRRAFGSDTVPGTYEDLEQADLVVLVGSNLAWCHPVLFQRLEAAKTANPAMRVVVIDPRETATCILADLHLALKPDTDTTLFNGLLAFLTENDAIDRTYVDRHTEGLDAALAAAGPAAVNRIAIETGLRPEDVALFYQWVARTERTVTVYSQGVNQSIAGTDKVNAILNTHLATGRIGRPGRGPFSVTGQPNAMGGREVGGLANMLAAHMALENPAHRALVKDFWQSPVMADKPGLKAVDLFQAARDGKIKALWIMATNPVDSLPDADAVGEALQICPFVVVSDVTRFTDTAVHADVLLPAAAWGEKDGTVTNSERRIARQRPFVSPPGEARADWWQICEVAKRMGFGDGFSYARPADIFREHAALSAFQNDGKRDFDLSGLATVSDADYDKLSPIQWPVREAEAARDTRFFANGGFYTGNGKGRLVPVKAPTGRGTDRRYPLILNTGRVRDQWHTMTRTGKAARLAAHIAEPFAEINPRDAGENEIQPADIVEIKSPFGTARVRAQITDRVQPGSVFVPMHWTDQVSAKGRVDTVVASHTDPFSGQPGSKFTPVSIRRLTMSWFGFAVLVRKPDRIKTDYWAIAPIDGGWRIEWAGAKGIDYESVAREVADLVDDSIDCLSVADSRPAARRFAFWRNGVLQAAFFFSPAPVEVSRRWACRLFSDTASGNISRADVLAGRPAADRPDPGAIVCSCFGIGRNQIAAAAQDGATSVKAIGACLEAGTNCGSCRAEIQTILNETGKDADHAPDYAKAG